MNMRYFSVMANRIYTQLRYQIFSHFGQLSVPTQQPALTNHMTATTEEDEG